VGKKEYFLIAVMYSSLLAGVLCPGPSAAISGFIKYLMMVMLFLAFIKITPEEIARAVAENWSSMMGGILLSLIFAPAAAYGISLLLYPDLALPMLLLAGASTGVSAPFFTSICKGNISYCLMMAIATSIALPVSLPLMVKTLADATLDFDLAAMALFLATIIFVPLILAFILRHLSPEIVKKVNATSYPISLVVLTGINFGALGKYVPYLRANPTEVFLCVIFAIGLAVVLAYGGWAFSKSKTWPNRMAASGSQVWVNNILIIALAVHMNHALAATLSAVYLIPYYGCVVGYSVLHQSRWFDGRRT
jgi:BASS family bile acid:Na+ symporter